MILVTGAAGKTGNAVIRAVAARGGEVRALVRRAAQAAGVVAGGACANSIWVKGAVPTNALVAPAPDDACGVRGGRGSFDGRRCLSRGGGLFGVRGGRARAIVEILN